VANFAEGWQGLTDTEKRLFLTNYIKKIIVKNEAVEGTIRGKTKILKMEFSN